MAAGIAKIEPKAGTPSLAPSEVGGEGEAAFLHAVLCQLGLPRSPIEARVFTRTSGSASISLEAGRWYDGRGWQEMPLPSGTRPRLVLYHVCSEAIRTRSPVVEVEDSVRGFLKRLRIDTAGDSMRRFKRQMLSLAACRMQLGYRTATRVVNLKVDPIEQFEAWLQTEDNGQRAMWPGVVTLSDKFFGTLQEHAVPLDPNAIAGLQNSALALDTYTWLAHRLCRIRSNDGVRLSWAALQGQFGQEYRIEKDFKRELRGALSKALAVYQDAKVEVIRGGLKLMPSAPPVKRKGVVVMLPPPAPGAADPAPKFASAANVPAEIITPLISEEALDRVRAVAPGWDRQYLAATYLKWMTGKDRPKHADAAFIGWVKTFTKGKQP